jgi:MFS family permease
MKKIKYFQRYPKLIVIAFLFIAILLFFDRGLVGGLLPVISKHWGTLTNLQSGIIQSAFIIGFMTFGPISAHFATIYPVNKIMAFGFAFWSVSAVLCGVIGMISKTANQFWGYYCFVLSRTLLGIGEAAFISLCYSIIDDISSDKLRSTYQSIVLAGMPVGVAVGYAIAGAAVDKIPWYWLFMGESILGVLATILLLMMPLDEARKESIERKAAEQAALAIPKSVTDELDLPTMQDNEIIDEQTTPSYTPTDQLDDYGSGTLTPLTEANNGRESKKTTTRWQSFYSILELVKNPIYVFLVLGCTQHNAVVGALVFWAPTWIYHRLENLSTMSEATKLFIANFGFSLIVIIASILGTVVGGAILDFMSRRGKQTPEAETTRACVVITVFVILCIAPGLLTYLWVGMSIYLMFPILSLMVIFLFCINTPINMALLSGCKPHIRDFAISIEILMIHVIGDFPSPSLLGLIADKTSSLDIGMAAIWSLLIVASLFFILATVFAYRRSRLT